ncbi:putative 2,5-dichloro-2,5-cyclohexadiene-1,4-diol dehydrogenase [Macrophomina phaseolina]|uniref:2,5-dichloro-2,5-cyclohexadiene-1,4-diol dehydrogenase n=1 Tax=Macrophomina phaseolina TaxID=35725 RepID=A0ABQ8GBA0_9PEZI|nr:putative 2,5-dichloro-2,5-cyclohexadiene-1,4-diol dehydrogenase [Macrophomina phaseolina]
MAETRTATLTPPTPVQNRLSGKIALITGGGGAIGLATGTRLLLEDARVVLVDLNPDALAAAREQISAAVPHVDNLGDTLFTIKSDVTNEGEVRKLFEEAVGKWGRIDCAFLTVCISYASKSLLDTSLDEYERIMSINVRSAFLTLKHAAAAMRAQTPSGGSIILTSSIAGLRDTPGLSLYSTSKFALRGLAQTAAVELGQYNIRVNTIHPSGVDTPMFRLAWDEEKIAELKKGVPLGRVAEVDDISGVVSWLASEDARFVSGAMIKIDGGSVSF